VNYHAMTPIERFAASIVGRPLYGYQAEVANAILHAIEQFARYEEETKRQKRGLWGSVPAGRVFV
jgi:hypothetical protein